MDTARDFCRVEERLLSVLLITDRAGFDAAMETGVSAADFADAQRAWMFTAVCSVWNSERGDHPDTFIPDVLDAFADACAEPLRDHVASVRDYARGCLLVLVEKASQEDAANLSAMGQIARDVADAARRRRRHEAMLNAEKRHINEDILAILGRRGEVSYGVLMRALVAEGWPETCIFPCVAAAWDRGRSEWLQRRMEGKKSYWSLVPATAGAEKEAVTA